jgi:hypothetical protein
VESIVDLQDVTRNQHFLPQVEQKLNSINPLAKGENQKIFSFSLVDRESYTISLDSEKGFKINKTLSLTDIFSFDILEQDAKRYNFEKLFQQYESNIKFNTDSLIAKLPQAGADIKSEILNIFTSKLLNFVRNPYSIKKVLNTFPAFKNLHPTNPDHFRNFQKILNGRKPQQKHLCNQLSVSQDEYADWLSIIFLLLNPFEDNKPNFFEQVIKGLYEDPGTYIMVLIYLYDDKSCLLSDRGVSTPLPENEHMAWDFNLYSHGFIRYVFGDLDLLAPKNAPSELLATFKSLPKTVHVSRIVNDFDALAKYNRNVVYQCYHNVFSSSTECYGLQQSAIRREKENARLGIAG